MNGDESDGDCNLEVTMSFDDVRIDISGQQVSDGIAGTGVLAGF